MLQVLGLIGGAVAFVVKFIKSFLLKYVTFGVILSFQFTVTASTIAFVLFIYAFVITSFVALYNQAQEVINFIFNPPGSDLSCLFGLLSCMGITPALQNGVSIFFAALSPIMLFHLFKFTFWALSKIKDEIFKLGLLLGQALS